MLFRFSTFIDFLCSPLLLHTPYHIFPYFVYVNSWLTQYTVFINPYQAHMSEYQSPKDRAYVDTLVNAASKEAAAFFNLKHTAERKDGVIPIKYRELMSVAVALTTQCAYCIESHIKNAVEAGATREEIAETVFIAAALRAGGAVGNGLLAMRLFEEAGTPQI